MKVVIIGAGKTGRGFLARLCSAAGATVLFIDRSESLVRKLNSDAAYKVHFFGGERTSVRIEGFRSATAGSELAVSFLAEADLVFTAVAEQNLSVIAPMLVEAVKQRYLPGRARPLHVVTGENGIQPGKVLEDAIDAHGLPTGSVIIAEAAIFCSTVELPASRLDIQSEPFDQLPYDSLVLPASLRLHGMTPEPRFRELLQRKIYTYNCLSACIAYLGAFRGYEWYADAANNEDIGYVLEHVLAPLNRALSCAMNLEPGNQAAFADRALRKFRDRHILDDIVRNARDARRKLGPQERLIAPVRLIRAAGGDMAPLALVTAAALIYLVSEEAIEEEPPALVDIRPILSEVSDLDTDDPFMDQVERYFRKLNDPKSAHYAYRDIL